MCLTSSGSPFDKRLHLRLSSSPLCPRSWASSVSVSVFILICSTLTIISRLHSLLFLSSYSTQPTRLLKAALQKVYFSRCTGENTGTHLIGQNECHGRSHVGEQSLPMERHEVSACWQSCSKTLVKHGKKLCRHKILVVTIVPWLLGRRAWSKIHAWPTSTALQSISKPMIPWRKRSALVGIVRIKVFSLDIIE